MTEDETSDGGSCAASARRALVLLDLAFTWSKDAPFPGHWHVKERQRKSMERCIGVSVSLPPHLCETVHNADATRKFGRKDAV